ncbi:hypothetical protein OK349_05915 [Sphingomonas sp. BT-65]|uniref:hypothetical protein n=1 Tax=Sphingomonas sp. BT-65 TaxID=2989821 RepID=UPI002235BD07|nr:hypothetical protein [Sphingomonas sp. BT-65]MCW4461236.1 hypothetical protein [Sphingomonas sp. BT-65]
MERRLKMMIAGSIAVWVPVSTAAQASPGVVDLGKVYRLRAEPAGDSPALPAPHNIR